MSNEFSTEQLMFGKTGMSTPKNAFASIEGFDGDSDVLSAEMFELENSLESLDAYATFAALNNSIKVNMINRLKMNYNNHTIGTEALANVIGDRLDREMKSIEDAAPAQNKDNKPADKPKFGDRVKNDGFWKTIFNTIVEFFKKIWAFICSIPSKFKALFAKIKEKFNKQDKAADKPTTVKIDAAITKAKLVFDFRNSLNTNPIRQWVMNYSVYSNSVQNFWKETSAALKSKDSDDWSAKASSKLNEMTKQALEIGTLNNTIKGITTPTKTTPSELKKFMNNAEKNLAIATNDNDTLYKIFETFFGLKKLAEGTTVTVDHNYLLTLSKAGDEILNIQKELIGQLKAPHDAMLKLADEVKALVNEQSSDVKKDENVADNTVKLATFQVALKFACKIEQTFSKIILKLVNSYENVTKLAKKEDAKNQKAQAKATGDNGTYYD